MCLFRRLFLLLLVPLVAGLLFTGCGSSSDGPDPSRVVGRWRMDFQWRAIGTVYLDFSSDYTFESSSGSSGTWEISGDNVTWTYISGTVYTGTINAAGTAMSGTSLSATEGDWTATRVYVTEADIIGSWTLNFMWSTDTTYSSTSIDFNSDGTFSESLSSGTWTLTGDNISWTYDLSPNATYVGKVKVSGTEMFGTMSTSTVNGEWNATKN